MSAVLSSQALKETGRRVTHQRSLILELLKQSKGHLDAETLFIKAKSRNPRISLATVYRTLAVLKKTGLVEEHRLGESHGHFEAVKSEPHYHFTCSNCQKVIEFKIPLLEELVGGLQEQEKIQVDDVHIHISGLCPQCRKKKGDGK